MKARAKWKYLLSEKEHEYRKRLILVVRSCNRTCQKLEVCTAGLPQFTTSLYS